MKIIYFSVQYEVAFNERNILYHNNYNKRTRDYKIFLKVL